MALSKQEFTDAGRSMLGRAQAGETLTISKIVVGSGTASIPDDLWPLTALVAHQLDVNISAKHDYGQGTLLVEGSFLSSAASAAFQLRELGIIGHIGAEADRLYSVANVLTDPPDTVDPASPSLQAFKIKLVIDRIPAANLVIQIGPSENVIGQNLATDVEGPGIYKDAAGNVLSFKRIAAGVGIELTQDVGETFITIAQKRLTVNVDLYVPASHPQCPAPEVGFPTVQAAHDYLLQFTIPSNLTATIHVYSGTFAGAVSFTHPNSRQINLLGEPRQDRVVNAINYVDATHKNVQVTSTAGLSVGQRVYLAGAYAGWVGGAKITAIAGAVVTLSVIDRSGRPPYTTNDAIGNRRLSWFPSILSLNDPGKTQILLYMPYGIGSVTNFTLVGPCYGCTSLRVGGLFNNVHAWEATYGLSVGTGQMDLRGECIATDCDFGIFVGGPASAVAPEVTIINGCGQGILIQGGTGAIGSWQGNMPLALLHLNHCVYGLNVSLAGNFRGGTIAYNTNAYGLLAGLNSVAQLNVGYVSWYENNTTDLTALDNSYISYNRQGGGAPSCNPAAEVVGNQNSLIHLIP
jgi:hypothetical protein